MKKFRKILAIAVVMIMALPASAQFKIGPRLGVAVNGLHFNEKMFDKDNQAGFTGGVQAEFTVPLIGVGGDISVMYVHRSSQWMEEQGYDTQTVKADYLDIPLNFKYKLSLPAISSIIAPYVFTGPDFSFRLSKQVVSDVFSLNNFDVAWNFGLGIELIRHLQISASYGLGLTKALDFVDKSHEGAGIEGKNRYWTVTAAWLF